MTTPPFNEDELKRATASWKAGPDGEGCLSPERMIEF